MAKETPWAKQKRLLLEMDQKLFKVCTDPDSQESKDIILQYRIAKYIGEMLMNRSYAEALKETGYGVTEQTGYHHYEAEKTS